MTRKTTIHICSLLFSISVAVPAHALTISNTGGYVTSNPSATTFYDGVTNTNANATIVTNGTVDFASQPDPSNHWIALFLGTTLELTFTSAVDYVGFLWGSPDLGGGSDDNKAIVHTTLGDHLVVGADVNFGNGNFVNFAASLAGELITGLSLQGFGYAFETTNYAATDPPVSQTPLPATLPFFAAGLGALGLLGWRKKRKAKRAV